MQERQYLGYERLLDTTNSECSDTGKQSISGNRVPWDLWDGKSGGLFNRGECHLGHIWSIASTGRIGWGWGEKIGLVRRIGLTW